MKHPVFHANDFALILASVDASSTHPLRADDLQPGAALLMEALFPKRVANREETFASNSSPLPSRLPHDPVAARRCIENHMQQSQIG